MIFDGKQILITGGTGSLGKRLVRRLMTGEVGVPKKIVIFSRDEAKQHQMKVEWRNLQIATDDVFFGNFEDTLDFRIGDIRDYDSVLESMQGADVVISAAALKQVPVCEYFPFEAVKTNIVGAHNIVKAIRQTSLDIELVVGVSTDKACKPINTYGMTKAIQERIFLEANIGCDSTRFVCVRYGNVMGSRGSVIPLFQNQIRNGGPVTVTTNDMTRFLMSLDKAVDTVFAACRDGGRGDTYIPVVPAAKITDMIKVMIGRRKMGIETIGIRPGEKIHEILVSDEEILRTVKRGDYYVIRSILPEVGLGKTEKADLTKEMSSNDFVVSRKELAKLLKDEGHLDF